MLSLLTKHMEPTQVVLHFEKATEEHGDTKPIRDGLSSVVRVGDYIFLACDEGVSVERLKQSKNGYVEHNIFNMADYLPLTDTACEIDIEGIDFENHYLWITGSHGLKRKKPDEEKTIKKQIKQLAKVESESNRYILARIPLVKDAETGEYNFHKSYTHPDDPDKELTAACLTGSKTSNELMDALQEDNHLKHFLKIPGKDNGFDIEGLTVDGPRIFLGLRGPVLRGWAVILEIETEEAGKHTLRLKEIGPKGQKYKKHFLDLGGMGIRELTPAGKGLIILAGPTMDLDGTIALYRWKNALEHTRTSKKSLIYEHQVERLYDIAHGTGENSGKDKAEGITLIEEDKLLVVYDSPSEKRKQGKTDVIADIFPIEGNNKKQKGSSEE
jgi:hypothetical protein